MNMQSQKNKAQSRDTMYGTKTDLANKDWKVIENPLTLLAS